MRQYSARLASVTMAAVLLLSGTYAYAGQATAAVATSMRFAMDEVAAEFNKANPKDTIAVIYGATGKLLTQVQQGAPFDLFFAADDTAPIELAKAGFAGSDMRIYAVGHMVIWSTTVDASKLTPSDLADARLTRIAIANPKVAPYGRRAEEILRKAKVWDKVESRLVLGQSITQTAHFVESGNAQVGLIALSLAIHPDLAKKGGYARIPDDMHQPLEQGVVLTKRGANNEVAKRFATFVASREVQAILLRYGFTPPAPRTPTSAPSGTAKTKPAKEANPAPSSPIPSSQ